MKCVPSTEANHPVQRGKSAPILRWIFLFLLAGNAARGDGIVTRGRHTNDPFVLTLYSPADLSSATATDLAVLIQRRDTGEVVHDATVELRFDPPANAAPRGMDVFCGPVDEQLPQFRSRGAGSSSGVAALAGRSANGLLYGTRVRLPFPGDWTVHLAVRQGGDSVVTQSVLPVGGPAERLWSVWPFLVFPPVTMVLFGLNQGLRRRNKPTLIPGQDAFLH